MTTAAEVVVVGAGILGCSIAVHLVELGQRPRGGGAAGPAGGRRPRPRLPGPPGRRRRAGRLLPGARVGPVAAACFAPNDGQVEPPLVLAACRAELAGAGVRFLPGRARVQLDDDGVRVEVGTEVLRPRTCVLAAGAEAVHVAAAVGLEVPTVASPGMLVQTRPLPPLTDRVVYLPAGPGPAVHLRQRADGSVLVGERTQETVATDPGLHHARALLAQAARCFPVLAGTGVDKWWLAYRAMPADGLPIVGPLPWLEGLYLAVSHSGVTLAPALGRLIAGEAATQTADGLLAPFRPARFAERATRVLLEVESVFRDPARQDRST